MILRPNLFFPKGTSIDADRLSGLTPAIYRLSENGVLKVLPGTVERELTIFSTRPVAVHRMSGITKVITQPHQRLILTAESALHIECPDESFIREEVQTVATWPTDLGVSDKLDRDPLCARNSPIGISFSSPPTMNLPGEGRLLLPTLSHGLSDVLWFIPDQHFRGQFKVHSNVDLILTPLLTSESKIVLEAIDLRAQSATRLQTDAIVFEPSPKLSATIPAGVAFRIQGRTLIYFRAEYCYYADSDQKLEPESDVLWLGVGLNWPAVRVPTLRLSDEFVNAHFAKSQPPD